MRATVLFLSLVMPAVPLHAQPAHPTTYCNPLDINYQYNWEQRAQGISYRAGADPVIVNHKGEYFLFVTNSRGWWHSKDLLGWDYVRPSRWPREDMCAPAACSVGDTLLLFQSTFEPKPIYYSTAPATGRLDSLDGLLPPLRGALGPWDPDIFHDEETGRWFMYFGSSNFYPVYGIELDPARRLAYKSPPVPLIRLDPGAHGWERFGRDHRDTIAPYVEGAWMTRYRGKYYLQYAAPGTEYNVYANGVVVGDTPLGPFSYAPYNPVSYKPGGFMAGAGHGCTFQDNAGNYWNMGTPWLAVNWNFERRIAMFPAGFDSEGRMYADTRFGDFPHRIPTGKWTSSDELFTGWMLLSYRKPCTASSVLDTFQAARVTDENPRTFWVGASNNAGQWITVDLQRPATVRALQVNYTDYKAGLYGGDSSVYTQFRVFDSPDGKDWRLTADLTGEKRDRPNAYIELPEPVRTRYIRYEHGYAASPHLAISDIRVFGRGDGDPPPTPSGLEVRRDSDRRNAFLRWRGVDGAVGYNIRWGVRGDRLHQTYQVWADQGSALEIRALTVGQEYYFAIEAFSENGVSGLSTPVGPR